MQFGFGDKGEVYLLDESVLPVTGKERRREGKSSISPRIKYDTHIIICLPIYKRKVQHIQPFITTDFQTIALSSLAIRLRSEDLHHLILRNGLPELQG